MNHVKPHGAMYNMAAKDERLALAIAAGIAEVDDSLILLGLSGSELLKAANQVGLKCANEVFADRAYEEDGSLVARTKADAVITNEEDVLERVIKMIKEQKVKAITGKEIEIKPDSICVHGDNPKALNFVRVIRDRLIKENIKIEAL